MERTFVVNDRNPDSNDLEAISINVEDVRIVAIGSPFSSRCVYFHSDTSQTADFGCE